MAVQAEQLVENQNLFNWENAESQFEDRQPLVLLVPEMVEDKANRQQTIKFIGSVALGEDKLDTSENYNSTPSSLMEGIHMAANGDPTARKMVKTNVRTDVIERTIKAGHVIEVTLGVNEEGKILQHGQTIESVQANTLRYASGNPKMQERTEAEIRNAFRIQSLYGQGVLEDYYFVVFSRVADNMTKKEMEDASFFVDTMSCAIQVTGANGGELTMESAFVAGVTKPDGERHDARAVTHIGNKLNINYDGKTDAQTIDMPALIHKSMLPNGASDLAEFFDEGVGGTFFGQAKPQQDYKQFKQKCIERERGFEYKVEQITNQLIGESGTIWSPQMATKRLHKISENKMVEHALVDLSIDPRAFGPAAQHIENGRLAYARGDMQALEYHKKEAKATAQSSSCPTATARLSESGEEGQAANQTGGRRSGKKEKMKCPFCKDENQRGDPCSPNQDCTSCRAKVRGGKVVSKGHGKRKVVGSNTDKKPAYFVFPPKEKAQKPKASIKLDKLMTNSTAKGKVSYSYN